MSRPLAGRIALVTGGGRNIGRAITLRLAAEGATVVINYFRSPAAARATKEEVERQGGRAYLVRASVARPEQRARMFDEIAAEFGALDILVNSAADGALAAHGDVEEAMIDRAIATNLKGTYGCAEHAVQLMAGRDGANIVNLSTLGGGQFVMANYLACGPAKAAVEAMTRYLAVEYAERGIRVNTAAAGMLASPVADQFPDADAMQRAVVAATPLRRLGTPEEFAEVVAFLASPRASWITGQVILADGGLATGHALLAPPRRSEAAGVPIEHAHDGVIADAGASAPHAVAEPAASPRHPGGPAAGGPADPGPDPADPGSADPDSGDPEDDVIAIVGMGLAVPGANDPEEFWAELVEGADRFVPVPADRWANDNFYSPDRGAEDKSYSRHSAFITDFVPHPALAAELRESGRSMEEVESTTLWLRHSIAQALDGVRIRPEDRCAAQVGYTADGSQYLEEATVLTGVLRRMRAALVRRGVSDVDRVLAAAKSALRVRYPRGVGRPEAYFPHRVGYDAVTGLLPEGTELMMVDTACSSSLYAVDIGAKGLLENRHDIAVCSGAFAVGPRGSVLFGKLNGLSERGAVRSLDKNSDGVLFSDGAATVILKRLSRARADGDQVLATIRAFGSSSDGKGKAIYAPSAAGQELAVRRAQADPRMGGRIPDWVVAHATGTPAGDSVEFAGLRATLDGAEPVRVTSNKSVIGHTGWAAGIASLIQVLLGLRHNAIPPQHRFDEPPAEFELDSSNLEIPTETVAWPRRSDGSPRVAAISGFGFGGTNAHLVVQDDSRDGADRTVPAGSPASAEHGAAAADARLAVVAVASHLPGAHDLDAWLADPAASTGFGDAYPVPPITEVKLPPRTMRAIDRCQLMILACAGKIRDQLGDFWTDNQRDTGVLLGHFGGTRNATLYATRCYLDDVGVALADVPEFAESDWAADVLGDIAADITGLVPASNEDTFPGMMPNVIPARVANYFGLNGPTMTIDSGFTSALTALDVAGRYLRAGDITVALIGGVNGNATPEQRELLAAMLPTEAVLAEGSFLLAVTTERTAEAAGLPVLGFVEPSAGHASGVADRVVECGATTRERNANFLAGEGAIGLLRALTGTGSTLVACRGGAAAADLCVRVTATATASAPDPVCAPPASATTPSGESGITLSERYQVADRYTTVGADGTIGADPTRVDVHAWNLVAEPGFVVRPQVDFWPDAATLVLTDIPGELAAAGIPASAAVLSVAPLPTAWADRADAVHVREVSPEAVGALLDRYDPHARLRHVRVVTDLDAAAGVDPRRTDRIAALHDLLFSVQQRRTEALAQPDSSSMTLLTRAMTGRTPHPYTGLFTGFAKVAHLEHPRGLTVCLVTDGDIAGGIIEAEAESMLDRGVPVAHYASGTRLVSRLAVDHGEIDRTPVLDRDSVIVAVGGGRGITAELMVELARVYGGRFYILGTNAIDDVPAPYLDLDDEAFAAAKRDYIRARHAAAPDRTPGQLNAEFQRIRNIRTVRANLDRIAAAGATEVTYLRCDVVDTAAVEHTMDRILRAHDAVDLLVNAAGLNRSAPIAVKDFAEFRRIRDIKLRGYSNLASALAARAPRLWCNFGSLLGASGQIGEVDYASANDFLGTASYHSTHAGVRDEFTIGWTLWGEVGLGANALTKAYFDKSGQYSNMSNAEGAHHFVRHLQRRRPQPYVAHLGTAEYGAVDSQLPGFLPFSPRPFYLDRVLDSGTDGDRPWALYERVFDLDTDGYLRHHLVNGAPTLPGALIAEMVLEAAATLVPDLRVYAIEDLAFHHFIKVPEGSRPLVKRIRAEVVDRRHDLGQARVRVTVTGDITAPNGTVLVRDKLHCTAVALMSAVLPTAPRWTDWYPAEEEPALDPYHHPASPVSLTGMFVSTSDTRLHPCGKHSTYSLRLEPGDPVFSRFRVPSILLDGLLRTGGIAGNGAGRRLPIVVPLRFGRLDLYEHTNDALVGRGGPVRLHAVLPWDGEKPGAGNRFTAVRPDGRIILTLKELDCAIVGYLDTESGDRVLSGVHENGRKQLV
ncbi:SDR family oxidoreductase [Nocardia bovistercoris]|uniref:SDR family oxidoreductase n=1 Tax=Nocardia bovistercoris TaxID=2785916 RepID=A0A931IB29_9NOCA|nr:SDR family oxidoreductase [Nocardia bovistercoris]MBH0778089.1 SDR family oxidoreductase [Nocardia bovistercoris]